MKMCPLGLAPAPDFHTVILNRLSFIQLSIVVYFSYKPHKCWRGLSGRILGSTARNGRFWPFLRVVGNFPTLLLPNQADRGVDGPFTPPTQFWLPQPIVKIWPILPPSPEACAPDAPLSSRVSANNFSEQFFNLISCKFYFTLPPYSHNRGKGGTRGMKIKTTIFKAIGERRQMLLARSRFFRRDTGHFPGRRRGTRGNIRGA